VTPEQLLAALESSGFVLAVTPQGRLDLRAPPGELTEALSERIEAAREDLLALLSERPRRARLDAALEAALSRAAEVRRATKSGLADTLEAVAKRCHAEGRLDDLLDLSLSAQRVLSGIKKRLFGPHWTR
jgi:hypothetical protein